jgi:hypothetical protein
MENNVLLGATDSVVTYDGSGVFNPNTPTSDSAPASSSLPTPTESDTAETKPTETSSKSGILLYAGLALAAYFFFFKKK